MCPHPFDKSIREYPRSDRKFRSACPYRIAYRSTGLCTMSDCICEAPHSFGARSRGARMLSRKGIRPADISIPTYGPSLDFTRTYDAQAAQSQTQTGKPGLLGYGWTDNWATSLTGSLPVPGDIYTIDGLATAGASGGATQVPLNYPQTTITNNGNIYIADTAGNRIEEVPAASGTQWGISMTAGNMYTIAGSPTGNFGISQDGTPAAQSLLLRPTNMVIDPSGNLFIADSGNNRVVEIPAVTGPGLLTWRCGSCKAWVGFGFVTQEEVCSGVAGLGLVEQVAEGGERAGAPWRGEGVEADEHLAVAGDDVAGGEQGFADQGVCLVACAGVVAVQGGGQGGFGVVGGHPDGVGDLLDLGFESDHVGGQVAEADPGREGSRGVFSCGEFPVGGPGRRVQGVDHLIGEAGRLAGRGAAQFEQPGVALGFGGRGEGFGAADLGGSGLLGWVRHQSPGVVR